MSECEMNIYDEQYEELMNRYPLEDMIEELCTICDWNDVIAHGRIELCEGRYCEDTYNRYIDDLMDEITIVELKEYI